MNHVYCFYDHEGNLLYVGKTTNLPQRMSAHFSINSVENEPWKKLIDQNNIVLYKCSSKTDLDIYETYFINILKPLYNKEKVFYDLPSFQLPKLKPTTYIYSNYRKTNDKTGKKNLAFLSYVQLKDKDTKDEFDLAAIRKLEIEYRNFPKQYLTEEKENILTDDSILNLLNNRSERERLLFATRMTFTNTNIRFDKRSKKLVWR